MADGEDMKRTKTPKTPKGSLPKGAQYRALVGMSYTPSVRDLTKRERKQAKQALRKGEE